LDIEVRVTTKQKLIDLNNICSQACSESRDQALLKSLQSGQCALAARAAAICQRDRLILFLAELRNSYYRFCKNPLKTDPGCQAKTSIVSALVSLDESNSEVFLHAIETRQFEPAYGGPVDRATELRSLAAQGIIQSDIEDPQIPLAVLLADPDPESRAGAARAIGCLAELQVSALLRFKLLSGDADSRVMGDCFDALFRVSPESAVHFVAEFVTHSDRITREAAILSLGISRQTQALEFLVKAWASASELDTQAVFLSAFMLHRSDASLEILWEVLRESSIVECRSVMEVLLPYHAEKELLLSAYAACRESSSIELIEIFFQYFPGFDSLS
jgi:hypothetical protein